MYNRNAPPRPLGFSIGIQLSFSSQRVHMYFICTILCSLHWNNSAMGRTSRHPNLLYTKQHTRLITIRPYTYKNTLCFNKHSIQLFIRLIPRRNSSQTSETSQDLGETRVNRFQKTKALACEPGTLGFVA